MMGVQADPSGRVLRLESTVWRDATHVVPVEATSYGGHGNDLIRTSYNDCAVDHVAGLPSSPTMAAVIADAIGPLDPSVATQWHRTGAGTFRHDDGETTMTVRQPSADALVSRTVTITYDADGLLIDSIDSIHLVQTQTLALAPPCSGAKPAAHPAH